jgi:hypothetical protein
LLTVVHIVEGDDDDDEYSACAEYYCCYQAKDSGGVHTLTKIQ